MKEISIYHPVSDLSCFLKILQRFMPNRLYSYLVNRKILYLQQFQKGHRLQSMPLVTQLSKFLNNLRTTIKNFLLIYLWHLTLLTMKYYQKVKNYGIKGENLAWLRSYLTNIKRYIQVTDKSNFRKRFNNLGLPLGIALILYTSVAKEIKLNVRKFLVLIPIFVEVTKK